MRDAKETLNRANPTRAPISGESLVTEPVGTTQWMIGVDVGPAKLREGWLAIAAKSRGACGCRGGGVAEMLLPHFAEIQSRMKNWCVNAKYHEIPLAHARYGEDAGVAGGAALCVIRG